MSIKAIDSQMMITRASDFVREANAEAKKGELSQQYSAVQAKAATEHDKKTVGQTLEVQQAEVKLNKDGGGLGGGGSSGREAEEHDGPEMPVDTELRVGHGEEHQIDITV